MSDRSEISWTDATLNIATGCTKISDACLNCYIERTPPLRMARRRFDQPGIGGTTGVKLHPERLDQPLRWRKPRRVFVCSLSDLFHDDVPDSLIARLWSVMAQTPQHTYQILTKRPARMRALLRKWTPVTGVPPWVHTGPWPLPNVIAMVTAENQDQANKRIPILLDTPAAVRGVSIEPMLGPIDLTRVSTGRVGGPVSRDALRHILDRRTGATLEPGLSWVICGGESGPKARPMHPKWARGLLDQCVAAGVPYHFKQWGEWAPAPWKLVREPGESDDQYKARSDAIGATHAFTGGYYRVDGRDVEGFEALDHRPWSCERCPSTPGGATGMRRVGKNRAGRDLDGRTWDEYPEVAR